LTGSGHASSQQRFLSEAKGIWRRARIARSAGRIENPSQGVSAFHHDPALDPAIIALHRVGTEIATSWAQERRETALQGTLPSAWRTGHLQEESMSEGSEILALAHDESPQPVPSTARLLGGIIGDIQDLVRKEIALARQELREELSSLRSVILGLVAAGAVLGFGILLLLMGLAQALAGVLEWPAWAGFATLGAVLIGTGGGMVILVSVRTRRVRKPGAQTPETVEENVEWLKERTLAQI
jgi:hypothetical protein